jgi:DNA-binding NarL/FixJ family response regulator
MAGALSGTTINTSDAAGRAGATIRVGVIDDHPVVGEGTAAVLRAQPGLEVVGVAASLDAARAGGLTDPALVDVLLLDIRLGSDSGLRLLSEASGGGVAAKRAGAARAAGPAGPAIVAPLPAVIVLTAYDYPQYAEAALGLGAAGFVLKTAPIAELVDAIRRVAAGGYAFAVRPRSSGRTHLTPREHEVVRLVADGRSNDEIGAALGIGAKTVETHLSRVFERFGVSSRAELAARAVREGWLDVPPAG